jgi:dTDP-4-amino-4,6-dideoxy-D-galactose acyltransferase
VSESDLCDILEWDSAFFGQRLARYRRPRFLRDDAAVLAAECEARGIDGVYILVDASDTESTANVQQTGAFLADVRVTFGTEVEAASTPLADGGHEQIRAATPADVAALAQIAGVSHRDTRFYADTHFDSARCDRLYAVWIENSCRGYADAVLVAGAPGQPVGYVTCHKDPSAARGYIGLFAVRVSARGHGIGRALMRAALRWFAGSGVAAMTVATQLRNASALRFYERSGLVITRADFWFHLWPRDART